MIISLDKFKNDGSGNGGSGKYVITDGTKFALSSWEGIPEGLDFSQVTDFSAMFIQATNLKTGLYLDDWSKADDCSTMYQMCSSLESVPDMNTSNCRGFMKTFQGASIVNAPNIDVSNAFRIDFMFDSCPNLQYIGELNTINVTQPAGFTQVCARCPNLTTIEGIDFSGIVDPLYCQITDRYNGLVMFFQNDSLTNITVNGAINFSWANDYGFNALPNLTFESIESILTAMSKCINPEVSKIMYFNYTTQDNKLQPLIEDCQSKGWDIQGISVGYPIVIIDYVPEEVEAGKDFEIQYTVHGGFDNYASQHDIILHVYDDYGYSEDFVLKSENGTVVLNDSNFGVPSFKTYVKYGERNLSGSTYSYTRVAPGVFFDDGDSYINIPYTGKTQELTIPFNMYGVDNYWTDNSIDYFGIGCNIEVIEGAVENYTHALHIVVDPNPYSFGIGDYIQFSYTDSDGNYQYYSKHINLDGNPDSGLGQIEVSTNYENGIVLPSSVDNFEILFNVKNAEYQETIYTSGYLENFNVSIEPTDAEGYTHVAHITYDNKSYDKQDFTIIFTNGYYSVGWFFNVQGVEPYPDIESNPFYRTVDTVDFGDPSNAIPVSFAEFAAAEPSNEQWYELTGVIRNCPCLEKGILVLDDPTGEYTVDEPQLNSWPLDGNPGIFINCTTTELNGGFDESFAGVFQGDGSTITIRTLKHVLDADYPYFSTDNYFIGEIYQGTTIGGKFNSPCAVYVGVYEKP